MGGRKSLHWDAIQMANNIVGHLYSFLYVGPLKRGSYL
ncbi:hypothetical protein DCCM_4048 [Desulfocucumis palustris]|uniref:Uncharacterized protein n=1 Tax=Desulfocucumis palustris TaxID=1898651 RepID=A0A2L2XFB2_9FIRM|nr:hypothetical protein DCCM_4048 [Desulfocucumis palustris]